VVVAAKAVAVAAKAVVVVAKAVVAVEVKGVAVAAGHPMVRAQRVSRQAADEGIILPRSD
jgi:hypothetical protein